MKRDTKILFSLIIFLILVNLIFFSNLNYFYNEGKIIDIKEKLIKTPPPYENYCEVAEDCVVNRCCHPGKLVNKYYEPDCSEPVPCTTICGILDCRPWEAICENNTCKVKFLDPPSDSE